MRCRKYWTWYHTREQADAGTLTCPSQNQTDIQSILFWFRFVIMRSELESVDCGTFSTRQVICWLERLLPPASGGAELLWLAALALSTTMLHCKHLTHIRVALIPAVCWCLNHGDAELCAAAAESMRVLVAVPPRERHEVLVQLDVGGGIDAMIRMISVSGTSHESAVVLGDLFRVALLGLEVKQCRDVLLSAPLPDILRFIETTRGLSGNEAMLACRLLVAIDEYRTALAIDSRGRTDTPRVACIDTNGSE